MKKSLLFVGLAIAGLSANAQIGGTPEAKEYLKVPTVSADRVNDTVWTYLNRASSLAIYAGPEGGSATGNGYLALATTHKPLEGVGQHYDGYTGDLVEILFVAGEADVINTTDQVTVGCYSVGTDSVPATLQVSNDIDVSSFDLVGGFTSSGALTPLSMTGDEYALTIEWAATIDDSVGVASNANGDGAAEGRLLVKLSAQTATEATALGLPLNPGWQKNSVYNLDADLMVFPVFDVGTGMNEVLHNGLAVEPVYPNPSNEMATISYTLDKADEVKVKVFNLAGQEVFTESASKAAGNHRVDLDVSNLNSGNYYYSVQTSNANVTMKFVVTK